MSNYCSYPSNSNLLSCGVCCKACTDIEVVSCRICCTPFHYSCIETKPSKCKKKSPSWKCPRCKVKQPITQCHGWEQEECVTAVPCKTPTRACPQPVGPCQNKPCPAPSRYCDVFALTEELKRVRANLQEFRGFPCEVRRFSEDVSRLRIALTVLVDQFDEFRPKMQQFDVAVTSIDNIEINVLSRS